MKFGNGIDVQNQKIVNLADPTSNTDAANKQYVDAFVRGLSWKQAVVAASTTNVTVSSAPSTLDGVTLAASDRVLLKDQSTGAENGIYVFSSAGAALTRASDADTAAEVVGMTVTVTKGSTNADRVYRLITDDVTLGTTALVFTELGGGSAAYTAGDGLTESPANQFNVNPGAGLEISTDAVRIAASAAGNGLTGGGGSALAVGQGDGITVAADAVSLASTAAGGGLTYTSGVLAVGAGDGISVAADAVAVDSTVSRRFSAAVGDGTNADLTVTHNLNTRDVSVTVRNASSPYEELIVDNEATTVNTVTLHFASAPSAGQYRVIVQS